MTTEPTHTPTEAISFVLGLLMDAKAPRLLDCYENCATIPTEDLHKIQAMPELEESLRETLCELDFLFDHGYLGSGIDKLRDRAKAALAKAGVE